jgi:hypothetical protein
VSWPEQGSFFLEEASVLKVRNILYVIALNLSRRELCASYDRLTFSPNDLHSLEKEFQKARRISPMSSLVEAE